MATIGAYVLFIYCFTRFTEPAYSESNTLLLGQQLKDGQYLASASGNYQLGFFSGSGRKRYVGIWHKQADANVRTDKKPQPVWIANRNSPIFDNSGILTFSNDGHLKISHNGGVDIVLFSVPLVNNTSATLLDTGNFGIHELNSDGSIKQVLWQSFDHPTDTLLPGMKLGINTKTGHKWSLTSWSSDEDPASGPLTLGMDPNNTNQLIIWVFGKIYWVSGLWQNSNFNLPHALSNDVDYHFSYHSEEEEKYFMYFVYEDVISFQRLTLKASGALSGMAMNTEKEILSCWEPSLRNGCFGVTSSRCIPGDGFTAGKAIMPQNGFKFGERGKLTLNDCEAICKSYCFCVAYASTSDDEIGCEIWDKRDGIFMENDSNASRYIYLRNSPFDFGSKVVYAEKSRVSFLFISIIIATIGGLCMLALLYCFVWRKHRAKAKPLIRIVITKIGGLSVLIFRSIRYIIQENLRYCGKRNREKDILLRELERRDGRKSHELQFFSFEIVASATNNFTTTSKLGEGGFGSVYKGQLPDGQEVAIKRLSRNSGQGFLEFKNEAILIAKLQHTNLVRLVGCCIHKEERMLIYEYMPNKSLDFFLFDPAKKNILDWKKRFNIIQGILQGLLYLHNYSRLRIIHRDLKASNILLDDEMNPKISDFGMARIFGSNDSEVNTNRVVGTYGYMPPEYVMEGVFSTKSDVFSFGVLLLEIISGQKNYSSYHSERPLNFIGYAWELWGEGRGLELIDTALGDLDHTDQVLRCINVGLLCVQESSVDRPAMLDVIFMIYNEANKLPAPKQPAFFLRRNMPEAGIVECRPENCSSNDISISEMVPR
uniref:Receptor-like serine/threonine-protein kinase n=1 Tax=Quercus lobata TaxID=97700 RepID=A0A7N2LNP9_QUELO